jgi:hypothetical protein
VVVLGPMASRQVILEVEDVAGGAVQARSLSTQGPWDVAVVSVLVTVPQMSRRAHLRWRFEAGAVWQYFAGEGDGVSGEVELELPVEGEFPRLLRKWRPLGQ